MKMKLYRTPQPESSHKILERKTIYCASCDNNLMSLIITTGDKEQKYRVSCPKCGDGSFVISVRGSANFDTKYTIQNVVTNNDMTSIKLC